jgi:cell division inhibitor SulA
MRDVKTLQKAAKQRADAAAEKALQKVNRLSEKTDWADELGEEERASLEAAIKEADSEAGIPHEEVMKAVRQWLESKK